MASSSISSRVASSSNIRAVLIDLSGTVHIGDRIIPGALEACQKLVQHNITVKFLTNTTKSSREELLEQLVGTIGFSSNIVNTDSLVTNTQAAKQMIKKHNLQPYCLVQESLLHDLDLESSTNEKKTDSYNSVLVGLAPEAFVYGRLNEAFRVLLKEKEKRKTAMSSDKQPTISSSFPPLIIALHRGKYLRDDDGGLSLGPGGFVSCLQEASGITDSDIAVMGKPSCDFFHAAIPNGISPAETAMIGDDVRQDVIGAKRAGLGLGILVKTGKYQAGDEDVQEETISPDITLDSIVSAVAYILERK